MDCKALIDKLNENKRLEKAEWAALLTDFTDSDRAYAAEIARDIAVKKFGRKIFIRGIVEFSNICKNDCNYCGIRRSNQNATRYRLTEEEILECCDEGYGVGFRTFVLQSGEDGGFPTERLAEVVRSIKKKHPDCAVTLSVGELTYEDYKLLREAGADRYLLRHETANEALYRKLHPAEMSLSNRIGCLRDLKELGYQVGAGMMIGPPGQTAEHLAEDMIFLGEFKPHMIGTGPFLPHKDTPYRDEPKGSYEMTLFLLSLCRIMLPNVLLPATTALGTIRPDGREQGVLAGANVIMPNLSPTAVRKKYMLYDNKIGTQDPQSDSGKAIDELRERLANIEYEIDTTRGDYKE